MIIVYAPKDGPKEAFDVGLGQLRASEIQIIERTADATWNAIKEQAAEGGLNAMRTIAWVLRKRVQPALRFAEFDPFEGELYSRLDDKEVQAYAERFIARYGDDPEKLAEAFDELRDVAFDVDVADAAIAAVTDPKDPSPAEPQPQPPMEEGEPVRETTSPSPTGS